MILVIMILPVCLNTRVVFNTLWLSWFKLRNICRRMTFRLLLKLYKSLKANTAKAQNHSHKNQIITTSNSPCSITSTTPYQNQSTKNPSIPQSLHPLKTYPPHPSPASNPWSTKPIACPKSSTTTLTKPCISSTNTSTIKPNVNPSVKHSS